MITCPARLVPKHSAALTGFFPARAAPSLTIFVLYWPIFRQFTLVRPGRTDRRSSIIPPLRLNSRRQGRPPRH